MPALHGLPTQVRAAAVRIKSPPVGPWCDADSRRSVWYEVANFLGTSAKSLEQSVRRTPRVSMTSFAPQGESEHAAVLRSEAGAVLEKGISMLPDNVLLNFAAADHFEVCWTALRLLV